MLIKNDNYLISALHFKDFLNHPKMNEIGEDRFCRICAELNEETNQLISPCNCKGTLKYVHQNCLKKSIEITRRLNCSICKSNFKHIRIGVKLPKGLKYTSSNSFKVMFYLVLIISLIVNDFFILHRAVEFYFNRINQIEQQLIKINFKQNRSPFTNYLDHFIGKLIRE